MIATGASLLTMLLVGFMLGQALSWWAFKSEAAPEEPAPPPPPPSVFERYLARSHELSKRAFLNGVYVGLQGWPPAPALVGHIERGEPCIKASAFEINISIAQAYVEGVRGVRAALSKRTGIDERALDEAVVIALEEVDL